MIVRQSGVPVLFVVLGQQAMGWNMEWLSTKELFGPVQSFILMAVIQQPFGDSEAGAQIAGVIQQRVPELSDLIVFLAQPGGKVELNSVPARGRRPTAVPGRTSNELLDRRGRAGLIV